MTTKGEETQAARSIRDGQWYWAPKVVMQEMAADLGSLALAVYHFLASMADGEQRCFPSQKYIANHLGCARASVGKAVKALAEARLVAVERRSRYQCVYRLLSVRCQPRALQMSTGSISDVNVGDTNNTQRRRINNNTGNGDKKLQGDTPGEPEGRAELLAQDLAEGLGDSSHNPFYLFCAKKYPESLLRELLSTVKQTPTNRIKKSRPAFFRFLLRQHEN